jgi:hypothetical protein
MSEFHFSLSDQTSFRVDQAFLEFCLHSLLHSKFIHQSPFSRYLLIWFDYLGDIHLFVNNQQP